MNSTEQKQPPRGHRPFRRQPRVLVTGGAGFIGSHVVEALLAKGVAVRVFDDLSSGKLDNLPMGHADLDVRIGSILEYPLLRDAMRGIRQCVHLAAQVSAARSVEQPAASAVINIVGFINILEAAREQRLQRLLYASSAAVYGDCPNLPLSEEETPRPVNPYGLEKQVDELYADLYQRQYGLPTLGLRFFNVYGPRQDPGSPYSGVISRFMDRLHANRAPEIFGDGHQTRDFIHVRDVARICTIALDKVYCGVCNVASGERVDLLSTAAILGNAFGVGVSPDFGPARIGDIRHSCGSPERMHQQLQSEVLIRFEHGLAELAAQRRTQHASRVSAPHH